MILRIRDEVRGAFVGWRPVPVMLLEALLSRHPLLHEEVELEAGLEIFQIDNPDWLICLFGARICKVPVQVVHKVLRVVYTRTILIVHGCQQLSI